SEHVAIAEAIRAPLETKPDGARIAQEKSSGMSERRYQKALPPDCFPRAAFKLADLLDELCASREEETVSVAPLSPESTEQFEIDWKSRHQKE
ncbi:hypothetical protein LCGC14_3167910, partial [marine sediment metagenome]